MNLSREVIALLAAMPIVFLFGTAFGYVLDSLSANRMMERWNRARYSRDRKYGYIKKK